MASSKRISPNRRKSIAVLNQNLPSLVPKNRRRAHSIVPGALSPLAKARRSLVPRKSILKSSVNAINLDRSSQQSTVTDDGTRSTDITQDFSAPVIDNTTRKSLGRRVSFARHSQVRMFETNHTNSTGSPQSSPSSVASPDPPQHASSNENEYPGRNSRRRSSAHYSMAGSEDMDMTTVINPSNFQRSSAILDEDLDYDDDIYDDNDDMEVTEAIRGNFARKRSLSMGRQPLAQLETDDHQTNDDANDSRSDVGNNSILSEGVSEERSQVMEFTIPLGQSLRPAEKDEAWLALKQVTHSAEQTTSETGPSSDENPHDESDSMELDDAMERLRRARDSLPLVPRLEGPTEPGDDTFSSTEDSFDNGDDGNKTLNLSQIMGRISIGTNARMSMGYQDSNMDESEVYGNIAQSPPRPPTSPPQGPVEVPVSSGNEEQIPPLPPSSPPLAPKPSVFQPPPSTIEQPAVKQPSNIIPTTPFSFTPRAVSPSKSQSSPSKIPKPKPTFSAAFAPPVSRPSPKKVPSTPVTQPQTFKRPRANDEAESVDADRPSPAKKQALASKWMEVAAGSEDAVRNSPPKGLTKSTTKPTPLTSSKRAPFQAASSSTTRPAPVNRRTSGYFARRKSLAIGFNNAAGPQEAPLVKPPSPKKSAGRMSLGSAPTDAWKRFDKTTVTIPEKPAINPSPIITTTREIEAKKCLREAARQTAAFPSPTRGSPAPARILPVQGRTPSPEPVVERTILVKAPLSIIAEGSEHGELSHDMVLDVEATQQWREGVEQGEYVGEEEEVPQIAIAQFFQMTGIKFMDELTAPRRSLHPGAQALRQPRHTSEIPLAEYVTAMAIDVPQLDLYSRVSKDLEGWMEKSKIVFSQAEEEAEKVTPELFVEYARADEEGQAELLHQLNLIRTHTRYLARSDWYDWKHQWVEGLRVTAVEAFASLENDARILEDLKKAADAILPDLEKEYEEVIHELEQEEAEVKEIEACDQDYLNELKASIAEQSIEIEALKAELLEATEQTAWIQEKLTEIDGQKREAMNTISTAQRVLHMKQSSTRYEVFRLKDELEALEDLHMFRITKVNAKVFEYVYASLFYVSIPCRSFVPDVAKVNISRYGKTSIRHKDDFPKLSSFLLATAKYLINEGDSGLTVRQILHRLNDYWASCSQLRSQLTLLNIKYPVDIILPPSGQPVAPYFKARTTVMFPSAQGKALVSFNFSFETISQWPTSLGSLDCEVDIGYGSLDRSKILTTIVERISQATPAENYACLLDACIEAQDMYH